MAKKNSSSTSDEKAPAPATTSAFAQVITLSAQITIALHAAIKERQAAQRDDQILRYAAEAHANGTCRHINQQSQNDAL